MDSISRTSKRNGHCARCCRLRVHQIREYCPELSGYNCWRMLRFSFRHGPLITTSLPAIWHVTRTLGVVHGHGFRVHPLILARSPVKCLRCTAYVFSSVMQIPYSTGNSQWMGWSRSMRQRYCPPTFLVGGMTTTTLYRTITRSIIRQCHRDALFTPGFRLKATVAAIWRAPCNRKTRRREASSKYGHLYWDSS